MASTDFGYFGTNSKMSLYIFFVVIIILLSSTVQGAPQSLQLHHRRHQSHLEWVNPCRGKFVASSSTNQEPPLSGPQLRKRNLEALEPLRKELQNFIIRLNSSSNAIDTSDIAAWFKHNSTFQFLPRINASTQRINLLRWHSEMQVYVGAFQQLLHKQKKFERIRNENLDKSQELKDLMILSRNALCEIETAINKTGQPMPTVLTRDRMDKRLTFRNNNSGPKSEDIDYLDNKFTKVRFNEYIHGMQAVMERPGKNKLRLRKKLLKNGQKKALRNNRKLTNLLRKNKHNRNRDNLTKSVERKKPKNSTV